MPSSKSFSVKRKAVPPLFTTDYDSLPTKPLQQPVFHHTIALPALHQRPAIISRTPSPKKKNPLSSIRKMLSLTRLNTTFSLPKESSNVSSHQYSNSGATWLPLSPLSPQSTDDSALSYPPSVLSSSNFASTSTSPTSSSFSETSPCLSASYDPDPGSCHQHQEAPSCRTDPEIDLATPVSQKSLLTSWYDDWFATQLPVEARSPLTPRRQDFFREEAEPRSFFEDDSDDEDYPISDSASEYSYTSIVPDCNDSDSDEFEDDGFGDEEDVTFTIGKRVTCRRASYHVFSASSSEDSHHSSRSSTPRARRAFEIERF